MLTIESGSNKSLYTLIAVVIFGIFLSLSYFMFQDQTKGILASVLDGVETVTGGKISNTLVGNGDLSGTGETPTIPDVVLVPNPESDFTFTSSSGTITAYNGTRKDVVIPATLGGVVVKAIGTGAFRDLGLTSVVIPNGLISIQSYAFYNNNLTTMTLPNSITSVGQNSFNKNAITTLTLSETITYIGIGAFNNNKLTTLVVPNSVTVLDTLSFGYNQLTSVSFGPNLKTIGSYAFSSNMITSITIPSSVTTIGGGAFQTNNLTTVEIPKSVTSIGDYGFMYNPLISVKLPTSTSLGIYVFGFTSPPITKY